MIVILALSLLQSLPLHNTARSIRSAIKIISEVRADQLFKDNYQSVVESGVTLSSTDVGSASLLVNGLFGPEE